MCFQDSFNMLFGKHSPVNFKKKTLGGVFSGSFDHTGILVIGEESTTSSHSSIQGPQFVESSVEQTPESGPAKKYSSPLCQLTQFSDPALVCLQQQNTNPQVVLCEYCDSSFASSSGLRRHVNGVHFRKFPFYCEYCGKGFNLKSRLDSHKVVHILDSPVQIIQNSVQQ